MNTHCWPPEDTEVNRLTSNNWAFSLLWQLLVNSKQLLDLSSQLTPCHTAGTLITGGHQWESRAHLVYWGGSQYYLDLPISPHFPGKVITPSFGFNKNNCLVFLLTHDFFHQTNKPVMKRKQSIHYLHCAIFFSSFQHWGLLTVLD